MLLYLAWRLAGPIARALPLRLAYALSGLLMDAVWHAWPQGRRAMRANLRTLLASDDPTQLDHWSQRQLRRYGELLVDTARLPLLDAATAPDLLVSDQWPEFDAAMSDARAPCTATAPRALEYGLRCRRSQLMRRSFSRAVSRSTSRTDK